MNNLEIVWSEEAARRDNDEKPLDRVVFTVDLGNAMQLPPVQSVSKYDFHTLQPIIRTGIQSNNQLDAVQELRRQVSKHPRIVFNANCKQFWDI